MKHEGAVQGRAGGKAARLRRWAVNNLETENQLSRALVSVGERNAESCGVVSGVRGVRWEVKGKWGTEGSEPPRN